MEQPDRYEARFEFADFEFKFEGDRAGLMDFLNGLPAAVEAVIRYGDPEQG